MRVTLDAATKATKFNRKMGHRTVRCLWEANVLLSSGEVGQSQDGLVDQHSLLGRNCLPVLRGEVSFDLLWYDGALAGTTDDHTAAWQVTEDGTKRRWQLVAIALALLRQPQPQGQGDLFSEGGESRLISQLRTGTRTSSGGFAGSPVQTLECLPR